jgi:hypothetical protein
MHQKKNPRNDLQKTTKMTQFQRNSLTSKNYWTVIKKACILLEDLLSDCAQLQKRQIFRTHAISLPFNSTLINEAVKRQIGFKCSGQN